MREAVAPWRWYWLCVAGWTAMFGAWMAAADVLGMPNFSLRCGAVLAGAFAAAYYIPFAAVSRWAANLTAFGAATLLATLDLRSVWLPLLEEAGASLGATYRLLIAAFLWVMVWRALAIRTPRDMLETTVPVGSVLLLALVSDPGVVAIGGAGLALLGAVVVMALVHEQAWAQRPRRVRALVGQRRAHGRSANSWPTVYAFALIVATAASQGLRSFDLTTLMGRELQIRLARIVAAWLLRQPVRYVSHEPRLSIYSSWPTSGQPLFEVQTRDADNWRMTAYEKYFHGIWMQRTRRSFPARQVAANLFELPPIEGSGVPRGGKRVRMVVRARVPMAGAIPSRLWPRWVRAPARFSPNHFRIDRVGSVMCTRYIRPGDSYELICELPGRGGRPLDPKTRRLCLELPRDVSERLRNLAQALAGRWKEPAAKVAALAAYLRNNYQYDLFPPTPDWQWGDPTEYFLFVSRRGFCVHFASALALMCRAIGYPARVVSGFLEGELIEGRNVFLVRARDAHAWVEVYLPGQGWTAFDPTPPRPPTPGEVAAEAWDNLTGAIGQALVSAGRWAGRNVLDALVLVAVVGGLAVARRQWLWMKLTEIAPPGASPAEQVRHAYAQMLRWLKEADVVAPPSATPLEVAGLLDSRWGTARDAARTLAAIYTRAVFSPRPVSPREAAGAVAAARQVLEKWLELRKARRKAGRKH